MEAYLDSVVGNPEQLGLTAAGSAQTGVAFLAQQFEVGLAG